MGDRMSTINVNSIDKESGSTLTLGGSGTTVDIPSGATFDTTGVTVTGLPAKSNIILNGGFDIWQRQISFTSTGTNEYSADRFRTEGHGHSTTISRQTFTPSQTDVPNYPTYFCRIASTSTVSAGEYWGFQQRVERPQFISGNDTYTLSFWVKSTAPVSAGAFTFGIASMTAESSPALTTSWQKVTATATIASSGSYVSIYIVRLGEGQGNFTVDIADVQLEIGSVANSFERRNVAEELALCQRYYEKSNNLSTYPGVGSFEFSGAYNSRDGTASSVNRYNPVHFAVCKRAFPTMTIYDGANTSGKISTSAGSNGYSAFTSSAGETGVMVYGTGFPSHYGNYFHWVAESEL